jgi:hypothetical protein
MEIPVEPATDSLLPTRSKRIVGSDGREIGAGEGNRTLVILTMEVVRRLSGTPAKTSLNNDK